MSQRRARSAGFIIFLLFVLSGSEPLLAQVSGSISGIVEDSQQARIAGAIVALLNQSQGSVVREAPTADDGGFIFTPLDPGTYTLTVTAPGFKKYEKKNIILDAQSKMGLPPVQLEIGSVGESIQVAADAVTLQTVSAERSGVITGSQMVDIASLGRNFSDLMKTVPGVSADGSYVNGTRSEQNQYSVDGISFMDTGVNVPGMSARVNTDSIAEFKVLSSAQQAEFGRAAGANITAVTKSGTRDLHGVVYWFHRHEGLNATSFTDNYNGRSRTIYRLNTVGGNIGGPIYIPGKLNRNRDKLFFFANLEWQRPNQPDAWTYLTVPTLAERQGDFSQTVAFGSKVVVKDPTTTAPFPGNLIPQAQWNAAGASFLNWFPKPNSSVDPSYNYTTQFHPKAPIDDQMYRFDYNISARWKAYFRLIKNNANPLSATNPPTGMNGNMGQSGWVVPRTGSAMIFNLTTLIGPTTANELIVGRNNSSRHYRVAPDSRYSLKNAGINMPVLYTKNDPGEGLIPSFSFGSQIPNGPTLNAYGSYYENDNPLWDVMDNLTKAFSSHTLKVGFSYEHTYKAQTANPPLAGSYDFSGDSANPGDTSWPYATALLGNFRTFQQASRYLSGNYYYQNIEWFAQDTWKVHPNLTLDYGIRFSLLPPEYEKDPETGKSLLSSFWPAAYDTSKRVALYQRAINPATGKVAAYNPVAGTYGPAVWIGGLVPGVGDANDGLVPFGASGYNKGFLDDQGLLFGPRFGLAWIPPGMNRKTVLRVGGGVFYERLLMTMLFNMVGNPPAAVVPTTYYGNMSTLAASGQVATPMNVIGLAKDGHVPTIYNYNIGLQRELPFGVLLDVSYVGNQGRHQTASALLNSPGFGSAWLSQNQDPTTTPKYDGTTTLPVNFTRPYIGYGSISAYTFGASSNYNALQVSANRRMGRRVTFGAAYTWSKALGTASAYSSVQHPTQNRLANYGLLDQDHRQVLTFNYLLNLPNPGKGSFLDNAVGRLIFSNWQLSGLTTFQSGAPTNISYSVSGVGATTLNRMITGDETMSPRVVYTCNPNTSPTGGDENLEYLNTSCMAQAVKGSIGADSGRDVVTLPGINNWDISLYKLIPFTHNEQRRIQLRVEAYNAFNHTQWSALNVAATFNSAGKIANLPTALGGAGGRFGFGAPSTARSPRNIQLAMKVYF